MNDFTIGTCVGLVQTVVGHPLDSIKTNFQNNSNYNIKYRSLYNGLRYPMVSTVITNGFLFHFNNSIESKINNSFLSGFATGIICAPMINVFEVYKVKTQLSNKVNFKNNKNLLKLGLTATLIRESFGTCLYFGTYNFCRKEELNPFFSGAIAGSTSWLTTYPVDVVKTRVQSGEFKTYRSAIRKGNLLQGLGICLFRSILVNGISFTAYDFLKF